MNLEEVLPPGSVLLDLSLSDKSRAISHVAGLLAEAAGTSAEVIEASLLAREALGSTGVGGGVGLPHARLHLLTRTHVVFVRLSAPINFESIDARPVDLLCGVVAPDEPNAELLTAVGAMARVLRDGAKTTRLRETRQAQEARQILVGDGSVGR